MVREPFNAGRIPSANPAPLDALTRDDMADFVRLCELGDNLERAATRWARAQAQHNAPARLRQGGGLLLAAVVIGLTITFGRVLVSARRSSRPRLPPAVVV